VAPRAPGGGFLGSIVVGVAVIAYMALLHAVFQHIVAPDFTYLRYAYRPPEPTAYVVAMALVVALALVLPRRLTRPSHFIAWVLFIVTVAPSIVVPQYADVLPRDESLVLALWVALAYLPVAVFGTRRAIRGVLSRISLPPTAFWTVVLVVAVLTYAYVIATVGLRSALPSLEDVYGLRDEFNTEVASTALLGYAVPLLANLINPLIIARGLLRGPWVLVLVGVGGQLFIYSIAGYRAALLSPLAVLAAWLLFRRSTRPPAGAVLIGTIVLVLAVWGLDRLFATNDYTSLIARRLLITPGLLTAGYVSVFDHTDKVAFSHSFLSSFSTYPYAEEPPLLVGDHFFDRPGTHANASFLADGYANLGFPGMILEGLVLAVLLCLVDDACRGLAVRVGALLFVMQALALADSGVFTVMLTHALGATVLTCALAPRTGWSRRERAGEGRDGPVPAPEGPT
jgi:hypothetical protein